MIEVFITNIDQQEQAEKIIKALIRQFPKLKFDFDLDDYQPLPFPCGHSILRVEGDVIYSEKTIQHLQAAGFMCAVLEDKICKPYLTFYID